MPLPEQLADIARELARRGRETSDTPTYTAGVRDTLMLVGELLRLSASGLPSHARPEHHDEQAPANRLRRIAHDIDQLVNEKPRNGNATSINPRVLFDLSRARDLVAEAAAELEQTLGLGTSAERVIDVTTEATSGRSTWLAAFALAVARQPTTDDRDVQDIVRLAGNDRDVLAVAARRVEAATELDPDHRRRARLLFARADSLTGGRRSATT